MGMDQKQQNLDLAAGEAAWTERIQDVELALGRLGKFCDAEMSLFMRLVLNFTQGGTVGTFRRSLNDLAAAPRGLCCGKTKAAQTVDTAEHWGLVTIDRSRDRKGAQQINSYSICWEGIRHVKMTGTPFGGEGLPYTAPRYTYTAPRYTCTAGRDLLRNNNLISSNKKPEPVPERPAPPTDPVVGLGEESEADGYTSLPRTRADQLRDQVLGTVPELIASAGTELEPLDPGQLVYGAFSAIEVRHIAKPVLLARWFRMQLGLAQPMLPGTEADALLVVAAGLYAQQLPEKEVRKNRVAVFVNLIIHRNWWDACPYVPEARRLIDGLISREGADWIGRKTPVGACS